MAAKQSLRHRAGVARVYLDHAATSPLRPEAAAAAAEAQAIWANPSSPHAEGRRARAALEDARARIKAALGWDGEVIFTSGASEALAIGLGRAVAERRLASAVEHEAVWRAAPDAEVVPVAGGEVDVAALRALLETGARAAVAVQSLNPETGTFVLRAEVAAVARAAGALVLADCAQSAGKAPLPDADMAVVSAHKLGGPIGIGALLVRDLAMLRPSGGQERGYRSGTENLPGVLGFAAAFEAAPWHTTAEQRLAFGIRLRAMVFGAQCDHIFAVAAPISATAALIRLDALGFAVSAGSACASGSLKPSRALAGFGVPDEVARRVMRVSLGWSTTPAELDAFAEAWASL